MAREKKVTLSALNITIHPHSAEKYIELFRDARRLKSVSRMSKDKSGLIASVGYYDKDLGKTSPITGDLYRFSNIDLQGDWFDTRTNQNAEIEDLGEVNVPEYLKPNSSRFSYLFFPDTHTLFYESYYDGHSIGNRSARKLIEGVFSDDRIIDKYGAVGVTIVPSVEKLSKALSMHKLETLTLSIKRPNPDDQKTAEREVLRRMTNQNVSAHQHEMKSIAGMSIKPDEETKILAHIAAKNGVVYAKGKDRFNHPIEYKTTDHPWTDSEYYDPNSETAYNTFANKAFDMKQTISDWFRRK